eukprot:2286065-Amphidinium_carterae.1
MNSYAMEPPITLLVDEFNYTNMVKTLVGDSAYTYVFSGMSGYLDHMLASSAAVPCISGLVLQKPHMQVVASKGRRKEWLP